MNSISKFLGIHKGISLIIIVVPPNGSNLIPSLLISCSFSLINGISETLNYNLIGIKSSIDLLDSCLNESLIFSYIHLSIAAC